LYSAPPDLLTGLRGRGPIGEGKEREGDKRKEGEERRDGKGHIPTSIFSTSLASG